MITHTRRSHSWDEPPDDDELQCRRCGSPGQPWLELDEDGQRFGGFTCDNPLCPDLACPQCEGSGVWYDTGDFELTCPRCGGQGRVRP